jgi:phosphoribosylformimino-5-aminoimidazole carboxamide ribotide isomerase
LQGDYSQETVYADDPVEVARRWARLGAERIHVVDLDGAVAEGPRNLAVVGQIVQEVEIPVQLGGGLKSRQHVEAALARGVERVVLGTIAVTDPDLVKGLAADCGERIVVGIDARGGLVAVRGWKETSAVPALDLAKSMTELGVKRFVYTDISRDGTLGEPNYEALGQMVAAVPVPVIASGGVGRLEHLLRLNQMAVEGAIVGRALYTGDVDLAQAIGALRAAKEGDSAD